MEFDKSRVYTAVNADELDKGDLCFLADNLAALKREVDSGANYVQLRYFYPENRIDRFGNGVASFCLAYLVCPARNIEAFKAWKEGLDIEVTPYNPKHSYIRIENDGEEPDWTQGYYRPAVEKPVEKKLRPFKDCNELCDFWIQKFVKGGSLTDFQMPFIWIKDKDNKKHLITDFYDNAVGMGICLCSYSFQELFEKFVFLDGTPCGKEA